jgi:tetratricopeptide (TPR) repeat protein
MPTKRKKLLSSAQKHLRNRNWRKALDCYEEIVDEHPDDLRARLKIADLFGKQDKTKEAVNEYEKVADHYARDSRYQKAVSVYKQALRLAPEAPTLHHKVGEAYHRMGRVKDAIRLFEKTFELYGERQDFDKQLDIMERIQQLDPNNAGVTIQLAELYTEHEQYEKAGQYFEEAADQLDEEGRIDDFLAIAERQLYCQDEPNIERRRRLVEILRNRGEYEDALEHIDEILDRDPSQLDVVEQRVEILENVGRNKEAVDVLRELRKAVDDPDRKSDIKSWILNIAPFRSSKSDSNEETDKTSDDGDSEQNLDDILASVRFLQEMDDEGRFPDDVESDESNDNESEEDDGGFEIIETDDEYDTGNFTLDPNERQEYASGDNERDAEETPMNLDAVEEAKRTYEEYEESMPDVDVDQIREEESDVENSDDVGLDTVQPREEFEDLDVIEEVESADDPTTTGSGGLFDDEIEEIESFIQFGLLDRAEKKATELLEEAPLIMSLHELLLEVYEKKGDTKGKVGEYLRMAEMTKTTPKRAKRFLESAMEIASDTSKIHDKADELDIEL